MTRQHVDTDSDSILPSAGRIGRGIRIKGLVRGKEDLVVEGEVNGTITLPEHHVVLELPSRTSAEVRARNTTLRGRHRGNAEASERLEITAEAVVIGDLRAPRLVIREGAKFRGAVKMDVPLPPELEDVASASSSAGKSSDKDKDKDREKDGTKSDGKENKKKGR